MFYILMAHRNDVDDKMFKTLFHWSFEHSCVFSVVGYKSTDQQTMGNSCRHVNHENTFSNYHSLNKHSVSFLVVCRSYC